MHFRRLSKLPEALKEFRLLLKKNTAVTGLVTVTTLRVCGFFPLGPPSFPGGISWKMLKVPDPFSHATAAVSSAVRHEEQDKLGSSGLCTPQTLKPARKAKQQQLLILEIISISIWKEITVTSTLSDCFALLGMKDFTASLCTVTGK